MGKRLLLALLVMAGGCGDGINEGPDTGVPPTPDAPESFPDASTVPDATIIPDAQIADVLVGCAATGTYVEADDAGNDAIHGGTVEDSGLAVGAQKSIGGCMDPQYATSDAPPVSDADVFSVTLGTANFVSGRIFSPQGAAADGGIVAVVNSDTEVVTTATLAGGEALLPPVYLPAGDYLVAVYHPDTTLAEGYVYSVELRTYACSPQTDPPDYSESNDGPEARGNDTFTTDWNPQFTDVVLAPTAAADAPEDIGAVLTSGHANRRRIDAMSADVSSLGDDYLDRDSFRVRMGSTVRRVFVVVDWIGSNNDLDVVVIPRNQIDTGAIVALGTSSSGSLERASGLVAPSSWYWLWVGNFEGSAPPGSGLSYRVTVCGYP